MVILINGPLGIGKSTLAEALHERLDSSVMLDGDAIGAVNPASERESEYLHQTLALLVGHHLRHGYRHFVINHLWRSSEELDDLRTRLLSVQAGADIRCFLLQLPLEENLRRIARRQQARALDETEFEYHTVHEERRLLSQGKDNVLGEPFDVSADPAELVTTLLSRLGIV